MRRGENPGPARGQGEVPEGGLRGPSVRINGTPQIPIPAVGPGSSWDEKSTLGLPNFRTCGSLRDWRPCERRGGLKMAEGTIMCPAWSPGSIRGRIEAVRPQQGGILALARGPWRAQSVVSRVSSFLTAGLGTSGGEILRAEVKASGWQRLYSPTPMLD